MNKNDAALSSYLRELGVTRERVLQLEQRWENSVAHSKNTGVRSKQSFSPPRKATRQKNLKSCEM
jgi:hypothetical protein